jgi:exodeoxyribonuclease-5
MELTAEQTRMIEAFDLLYHGHGRRLVVGGHAGTGKTLAVREIVRSYPDVVVCAPTGKAAHVLRTKGVDDAVTIHSLIYKPIVTRQGLEFTPRYLPERIDVAIVDEASMLSSQLVRDLERKVCRVMYVGDHGQLEPIGDDARLMASLDLQLTQVHRQVAGSPIIRFAHHVRRSNFPKTFGDAALVQRGGSADLAAFDIVLCGRNRKRVEINAWIRKCRGFRGALPEVGEQVICLRNDSDWGVWNGMGGKVTAIDTRANRISVDTDDGPRHDLPFVSDQFGQERTQVDERDNRRRRAQPTLWDFGYCVTVHKSQGSEWPRVAVLEDVPGSCSPARWRYTAATRASQELRWVL